MMRRKSKIILTVAGAVWVLLVMAAAFVPLFEFHRQHGIDCGCETRSARAPLFHSHLNHRFASGPIFGGLFIY